MTEALATWDQLAAPWRLAFEEAWESFRGGNFGIGAVLVDPATDSVVSIGRNRVAQVDPQPRMLSGNMTAHAEMNAFAALDRFSAEGLHLYTTLEPCLMCAATAMQLKLEHVHFAAADEFYVGLSGRWEQYPVTAERQPLSTGPMSGPLANFARLLPMVFTTVHFAGRSAEQLARQQHPTLAGLTDRLRDDRDFADVQREGRVQDALAHLWEDLEA